MNNVFKIVCNKFEIESVEEVFVKIYNNKKVVDDFFVVEKNDKVIYYKVKNGKSFDNSYVVDYKNAPDILIDLIYDELENIK